MAVPAHMAGLLTEFGVSTTAGNLLEFLLMLLENLIVS